MIDLDTRAIPGDDSHTHINTTSKARTNLGRFLSLSHNTGDPIIHPILGSFHTVENMWCYLNTGGNRDKLRYADPDKARTMVKLSPHYSCNKFREAIIDATILKIQQNSQYMQLFLDNDLPFDHYFLNRVDQVPIRPRSAGLVISILTEVDAILREGKKHEFVRFYDMTFKEL